MADLRRVVSIPGGGGSATSYWETMWASEKLDVPPALGPILRREVTGRQRILEAGCGQGSVVRLLRAPDRTVVGVDLAVGSLVDAKATDPSLALAAADISILPFPSGAFDAVLSLGVVEHLVDGPIPALAEHARVLEPRGALVLTVPHRSWWRAATDTWQFGVRRRSTYRQGGRIVSRRSGDGPVASDFHQYELSRRQLCAAVEASGLRVVHWEPIDVGRGLRDLRRTGAEPSVVPAKEPAQRAKRRGGPLRRLARHLTTGLEPAGPLARACRRTTARALGHGQLVVATPKVSE